MKECHTYAYYPIVCTAKVVEKVKEAKEIPCQSNPALHYTTCFMYEIYNYNTCNLLPENEYIYPLFSPLCILKQQLLTCMHQEKKRQKGKRAAYLEVYGLASCLS